jgi:hypothetical protein
VSLPSGIVVAVVLSMLPFAHALAVPPAASPRQDAPPDWKTWLVVVDHVDRQDPTGRDADRLRDLRARIDAAARPAEKRRLRTAFDRARDDMRKRCGYVVYGWSTHADAEGAPVDSVRSMSGFFIPLSEGNTRALDAAARRRSPIAVAREGSRDLFTCSGRRYFGAERAVAIDGPPAFTSPATLPFPAPGSPRQSSDALAAAVQSSLTFVHTKPRNDGGELHRFMVAVSLDAPPDAPEAAEAWFHVRVGEVATVEERPPGDDGSAGSAHGAPNSIGPILERVAVTRSNSGTYRISSSFELITHGETVLDPAAVTFEPVSLQFRRSP